MRLLSVLASDDYVSHLAAGQRLDGLADSIPGCCTVPSMLLSR